MHTQNPNDSRPASLLKRIKLTLTRIFSDEGSRRDFQKLIQRELPQVYAFYLESMEKTEHKGNSLVRFFHFLRNLFAAFLEKLSPARRLFYTCALIVFLSGYITSNWIWILASFLMINLLVAVEVADKLLAKDELQLAREVQLSLMPAKPPQHEKFEIIGYSEAAREVGGDYYNILTSDDSSAMFVVIGDISGKGMGAALHMVQVQAILKHLIDFEKSPKPILNAFNAAVEDTLPKDFFFSVGMAKIDDSNISFSRAGHTPMIHYKQADRTCCTVQPRGLAVGLNHTGAFDRILEQTDLNVDSGDLLFFYTDGVTETMNSDNDEYGEDRLHELIERVGHLGSRQLKDSLLAELNHFRGKELFHDDLTFVIVKAK